MKENSIVKNPYFKRGVRTAALAFIALVIGILIVKRGEYKYPGTLMFTTMSTSACVWLNADDEKTVDAGFKIARQEIMRIEKMLNIFDPESELAKLNASASDKPFHCSDELWEILQECRRFHKLSGGAFDVTIDPIMKLWGFHRRRSELPSQQDTLQTLSKVGLDKVKFDDKAKTVFFTVKGMALNLGGIAKGWALDKAAVQLQKKVDILSGYLDLGGNVLTLKYPMRKRDKDFIAQVRDPIQTEKICASIQMRSSAIATSGNYERYVTINGKQYTHIMDPRTGKPVENMLSVTVVTERGIDSDALSTTLFILGPDAYPSMKKEFPDLKALFIRRKPDKSIEMIPCGNGWQDLVTPAGRT